MATLILILATLFWSTTIATHSIVPDHRVPGAPASASTDDRDTRERMIVRAFSSARYERALRLVDEYLAEWPESPHMHYNRACAFALLTPSSRSLVRPRSSSF